MAVHSEWARTVAFDEISTDLGRLAYGSLRFGGRHEFFHQR
jgi:hypothetical protein